MPRLATDLSPCKLLIYKSFCFWHGGCIYKSKPTLVWVGKFKDLVMKTENERNRDKLQAIIDCHFGKRNVVVVILRESWNFSAKYGINGEFSSFSYLLSELKKL